MNLIGSIIIVYLTIIHQSGGEYWWIFAELQTQVAQAPKGAVNMTLRNSVIFIRVCMGI